MTSQFCPCDLGHRTYNLFNSSPNRTLPGSMSDRDSTPPPSLPSESPLSSGGSLTAPALGVPCLQVGSGGPGMVPQGSLYPGLQPWLLLEPRGPPLPGPWRHHLPSAGLWKGLRGEDPKWDSGHLAISLSTDRVGSLPSGACRKCDLRTHGALALVTSKHRGRVSICPQQALSRKALSRGGCGEGFGEAV